LLNVLQVCDHLGWEGSRMHGVKRLFSWMIPRFDPDRFRVSLVSLRKKDLSEETLEAQGVDITYLHRSKFDPLTLRDLLRVIDRQQIDVLHLHGYGATTFGRMAAALRGLPAILHEHANLTDTPWFQKVADYLLEPCTDIAIAVSKSTADFVIHARLVPASKVKVVYLGVPLEEFSRSRSADEIAGARHELGVRPGDFAIGTVTRLHDSKGNSYLVDAAARVVRERPQARFFLVGEGPLRPALESQAAGLGLGDRFVFAGFRRDIAAALSAFDLSVFPSLWEGTPNGFEAPRRKRCRHRCGRPRTSARLRGLCKRMPARSRKNRVGDRSPGRAGALGAAARAAGRQYDIAAFVRKMERLYTILHDTSRATRRKGVLSADLSFLTSESSA
jgi:glycosyltransferase involved in cell wall biosynthesis